MSSYNELLEELKNTLQKDNIESNIDQISLYDLFIIINSKFELLRSVTKNDKLFTSKQLFHIKKYVPDIMYIEGDVINIKIYDRDWDYYFKVCCEINSDDIFYEGHKSIDKFIEQFIKKYSEELNNAFNILKMFYKEKDLVNKANNYVVKHNYYRFNIFINEDGIVDFRVYIPDEENEIREIYERNYYDKKGLNEILEESKFELSKKIMIDVNGLDAPIKNLIYKHFNSSNRPNYAYTKVKK